MKTICTLEFRDGRPIAKEVNPLGEKPNRTGSGIESHLTQVRNLEKWYAAESERREFEIVAEHSQVILYSYPSKFGGITIGGTSQINLGDRFTATIENNLVTKIELI